MNVIQSFAEFEEGSPYVNKEFSVLLNFYSFFLSYLTLNKYYGKITMYCNQKAFDSFIKHIPYDKIIIKENKNTFRFWNKYKIDCIKDFNDDFIHVDSDVFIFDDLFSKFNNNNIDLIVQDIIPKKLNFVREFIPSNSMFFKEKYNYDVGDYDGRCISCGTFGIKKKHIKDYLNIVDILYEAMLNNDVVNAVSENMILEELMAYFMSEKNNLNVYDVLPYDFVLEHGVFKTGDIIRYTHLWTNLKFKDNYINLVKNKIKKEFPSQYNLVDFFDNEIMKKIINI